MVIIDGLKRKSKSKSKREVVDKGKGEADKKSAVISTNPKR